MEQIKIQDFEKLDLRVAEIQEVEDVENADRLYKLTISLGEEVRTICAAIKQFYSKDDLKGKKIIVLTNLEPRTIRGIESKGMLLAAVNEEKNQLALLTIDNDIAPGTKVS